MSICQPSFAKMCEQRSFSVLVAVCVLTIAFANGQGQETSAVSSVSPEKAARALVKLRQIIKEDELNLDYMKKDAYLLSWLRRHKFDVDTTAEKIRAALQWRKDNKVDNLLSEDFSTFTKNYPFDIEGVDRQGRPVWVSQIGKWDIRRIQLSGLTDKYNRYRLYLNELLAKKVREKNEEHPDRINYGILVLVDLGGFNLRQHGCIQCIQESIEFDLKAEAAYPDQPYKTIMVNAPRLFGVFYRTIRSIVPDQFVQNFEIYDFDQQKWQKVLQTYVAPDQLPTQYGGTRKTNLL